MLMSQFSEQICSDDCNQNHQISIASLLQQLLILQIRQIHQLQLIEQIRHQVLLFSSCRAEIPETLVICAEDLSSSKYTNQLKVLSAHLSEQLAAAAAVSQHLAKQSDFKQFAAIEQLQLSHPGSRENSSQTTPAAHKCSVLNNSQINFLS
ncbi:hypothetical protein LDENG_00135470 [Lucifuga dentata]|nr:hypothetical protein LDENG_00135470 [Lucifuga dentata]